MLFKTLNKISFYTLFWCSIWFSFYLDMLAWWSWVFCMVFVNGLLLFSVLCKLKGMCEKNIMNLEQFL